MVYYYFLVLVFNIKSSERAKILHFAFGSFMSYHNTGFPEFIIFLTFSLTHRGFVAHPKKLLLQPLMLIFKSKFHLLSREEIIHRRHIQMFNSVGVTSL